MDWVDALDPAQLNGTFQLLLCGFCVVGEIHGTLRVSGQHKPTLLPALGEGEGEGEGGRKEGRGGGRGEGEGGEGEGEGGGGREGGGERRRRRRGRRSYINT